MEWGSESVGLMGLAWDGIVVGGGEGMMHELVATGRLAAPEVTFYLSGDESEVTFGGADPSTYTGPAIVVPLFSPGTSFWMVQVSSVAVGSRSVAGASVAIVDTGTTLIGAPNAVIVKIAKAFKPKLTYSKTWGSYMVNCNDVARGPNVVVRVNGGADSLTLTSSDYVFPYEADGQTYCMLGFFAVTPADLGGAHWLLGDVRDGRSRVRERPRTLTTPQVFVRKYVTTFDYSAAQLVFRESASR